MPRCFLLPLMDSIIDWQWEGKCSGQAVCAAGCSPASMPCWGGGSPRGTAEAGLQVGLKEEPQGAQGYSGNWGGGGHMGWEAIAEGGKITFCPQERCTVEVCCSSACWGVSCHTDAPPSAVFVELGGWGGRCQGVMPACTQLWRAAAARDAEKWVVLGEGGHGKQSLN